MSNAMQTFTVQIPPDSLRRRAPNWIWITMASVLAIPLCAGVLLLLGTLNVNVAVFFAVAVGFGSMTIVREGWPRFFTTRVCVGDDGLHVAWRWGNVFVPITSIQSVATDDSDVVVTLTSGERCVLGGLSAEASGARDPLRAAIAAAVARRDARADGSDLAPRLARGGRAVPDWLAALRATAKSSAYRGAGIPRDELLRIAEDASAIPSARVGATIALGNLVDDERVRLRIAADASAAPAVREALPLAASTTRRDSARDDAHGDEEALSMAIAGILARENCE